MSVVRIKNKYKVTYSGISDSWYVSQQDAAVYELICICKDEFRAREVAMLLNENES